MDDLGVSSTNTDFQFSRLQNHVSLYPSFDIRSKARYHIYYIQYKVGKRIKRKASTFARCEFHTMDNPGFERALGPKHSCAEMSQSFRSQKTVVIIVFSTFWVPLVLRRLKRIFVMIENI